MATKINCLALGGDGDDVELIVDIERAFSVDFASQDAVHCETVGQLFDVLWQKLRTPAPQGTRCPTAHVFYRIRREMPSLADGRSISPSTRLDQLFDRSRHERLMQKIERQSQLSMPSLSLSGLSANVLLATFVVGVAIGWVLHSWLPVIGALALLVSAAAFLPRYLPDDVVSFEDLVRQVTAHNFGAVARVCGGAREQDAWKAMLTVVRSSVGLARDHPMDRETRFFAKGATGR